MSPSMEGHLGECGTCLHFNMATLSPRMHRGCSLLAMGATVASEHCSPILFSDPTLKGKFHSADN